MTSSNIRIAPEVDSKISRAREVAGLLAARVGRDSTAVRSAFIASPSPLEVPPLTRLLRGGRGGEVKLKLLLSFLWVAVAPPYDVTHPARVWAELLGLDDPDTKGAARVNAAIRRLEEEKFIAVRKRAGQPSRVLLLNELGGGEEYSHPGSVWDNRELTARDRRQLPTYTRVPEELWTNGWVSVLSGPAFAMLLILLEAARGREPIDLWFAPSVAANRYGLNEATRKKGLDQLEEHMLVTTRQIPVGKSSLSVVRRRNAFSVDVDRFEQWPESVHLNLVTPSGQLISSKK